MGARIGRYATQPLGEAKAIGGRPHESPPGFDHPVFPTRFKTRPICSARIARLIDRCCAKAAGRAVPNLNAPSFVLPKVTREIEEPILFRRAVGWTISRTDRRRIFAPQSPIIFWELRSGAPAESRIEFRSTQPPSCLKTLDGCGRQKPGADPFCSHLGNWELPALASGAHGPRIRAAVAVISPQHRLCRRHHPGMPRGVKMVHADPASHDCAALNRPPSGRPAKKLPGHVAPILVDQYFNQWRPK